MILEEEGESSEEIQVMDLRIRDIDKQKSGICRSDRIMFLRAKTCFDVKEYLRTADLLKNSSSHKGKFLRYYSMFLSGEKKKEEENMELKENCKSVNTELKNLHQELSMDYENNNLDAFGIYLFGVILQELLLDAKAIEVLIESCNLYPWNWSAWIALGSMCVDTETFIRVRSKLKSHYMTEFFVAHTQLELQMNEEALDSYDSLSSLFPTSRYIRQQIATCQFSLQDFDQAADSFDEMREMDTYCIDGLDIYSNILYVRGDAAKLSYLAHFSSFIDKYRPETCFIVG